MIRKKTAWRIGIVAFGACWALALILLGLTRLEADATARDRWIGVACLAAGQLVAMALIADRVAPPRRPALAWACQLLAAGAALAATIAAPLAEGPR